MLPWTLLGILCSLFTVQDALAVKSQDFKTCSQSGFCRRGRALSARAKEAKSSWKSPYSIDSSSVAISHDQASVKAAVKSSLYPDIKFELEVRVHNDGVVRVRMDEVDGLRKRYDEAASWALISEPVVSKSVQWSAGKKDIRVTYGDKKEHEVVVVHEPLRIMLLRDGKVQVDLNGQGLLHMEHFRSKTPEVTKTEEAAAVPEEGVDEEASDAQVPMQAPEETEPNPRAWFEGDSEDAYWEETFSSWTDSKPKGMHLYARVRPY